MCATITALVCVQPLQGMCATITGHYGFFHLSAGHIKSSQENEYITKTIDESI